MLRIFRKRKNVVTITKKDLFEEILIGELLQKGENEGNSPFFLRPKFFLTIVGNREVKLIPAIEVEPDKSYYVLKRIVNLERLDLGRRTVEFFIPRNILKSVSEGEKVRILLAKKQFFLTKYEFEVILDF